MYVPCFWVSTLSKKALSNQNNGHLGSRYIDNHSMPWKISVHILHMAHAFLHLDPRLGSRNHMVCQFRSKHIPMKSSDNLVGGWETQFQKICSSKWKKSPQGRIENKKYLKPPPSNLLIPVKLCPLDVSMGSVDLERYKQIHVYVTPVRICLSLHKARTCMVDLLIFEICTTTFIDLALVATNPNM